MAAMENSFDEKQKKGQHAHSVIVVAEGAGQYLMSNRVEKRDPSGNIRYSDIGLFLKESIQKHFEGKAPVSVRLIEPSYLIRSLPANPHDAIFCYHLADHAVHAGMAGRTDVMISYWNSHFTHVPLEAVVQQKKRIDPNGDFWRQVLFSTGQPNRMYHEVSEESDAKSLD
jgi:6-phosphofructokinase 1